MEASLKPSVGPRFEVGSPWGREHATLLRQVRRALRSLLGQRGGTMLLHAWGSGEQLRIECEVAGASAAVTIACSDDALAAALDRGADQLLSECVRCGCAPARIRCAGPATVLLPAA